MNNIVLIGMPGAGKSTIGVLLAKTLGMQYADTDLLVQQRAGMRLQEILDTRGTDAFLALEEQVLCSLACDNTVIATGGSAVLSPRAMACLEEGGTIVYLAVSFREMERRLRNIRSRGIVLPGGMDLRGMYDQRVPLYERYADITVRSRAGCERVVPAIVEKIHRRAAGKGRIADCRRTGSGEPGRGRSGGHQGE